MSPSRADLIKTAVNYTEGHDCPYAESLFLADSLLRQFGSYGISTARLSHHITELDRIHHDDICPPTHEGINPTREWADWVKSV